MVILWDLPAGTVSSRRLRNIIAPSSSRGLSSTEDIPVRADKMVRVVGMSVYVDVPARGGILNKTVLFWGLSFLS